MQKWFLLNIKLYFIDERENNSDEIKNILCTDNFFEPFTNKVFLIEDIILIYKNLFKNYLILIHEKRNKW